MAIAVHVVNKPKADAREAYLDAWRRLDERGLRHPAGRQSHTAWLTGDVLHVVDVWDSPDTMSQWMSTLGPVLHEFGMELEGEPEVGDVLQVVRPDWCCVQQPPPWRRLGGPRSGRLHRPAEGRHWRSQQIVRRSLAE